MKVPNTFYRKKFNFFNVLSKFCKGEEKPDIEIKYDKD